jgi:hypothetical protein
LVECGAAVDKRRDSEDDGKGLECPLVTAGAPVLGIPEIDSTALKEERDCAKADSPDSGKMGVKEMEVQAAKNGKAEIFDDGEKATCTGEFEVGNFEAEVFGSLLSLKIVADCSAKVE